MLCFGPKINIFELFSKSIHLIFLKLYLIRDIKSGLKLSFTNFTWPLLEFFDVKYYFGSIFKMISRLQQITFRYDKPQKSSSGIFDSGEINFIITVAYIFELSNSVDLFWYLTSV